MADQINTKPTVLLIGSPHLSNNNLDVFNAQFDDMLAARRQEQIGEVVARLAQFRPTKVAVESRTDDDDALNDEYQRYQSGDFALTANEIHQLGFRVAAAMGHERVYAVDWNEAEGYSRTLDEVIAYAQEHHPEIHNELMVEGRRQTETDQENIEERSVSDMLCAMNDPQNLARGHQVYLALARVGSESDHIGIGWVQGWYGRNMRIYANLAGLLTAPTERVLVIYGGGHIPLLAQFLGDSGLCNLESAAVYLG